MRSVVSCGVPKVDARLSINQTNLSPPSKDYERNVGLGWFYFGVPRRKSLQLCSWPKFFEDVHFRMSQLQEPYIRQRLIESIPNDTLM